MPSAYGSAFLIARGRHRGYQSLLVPDFLAASGEHGVLGAATGGGPTDGPALASVGGLTVGDILLAYRTRRLTDADLGSLSSGPLTDEFGRPLELLFGFVIQDAEIRTADSEDFAAAWDQAIRTYQRFLANESGFDLETSRPFVLRSVAAPPELVLNPRASPAPAPSAAEARDAGSPASLSSTALRNVVLIGVVALTLSAAVWILLLR